MVVWRGRGQGDAGYGVFGQRYDSEGVALGPEFPANANLPFHQDFPSVASDANGNFVVVWESREQDGSDKGIFGQRFDRDGEPLGSEFRVNSYTTSTQYFPSAASDASGNFVVVWAGEGETDSSGIFGQRYDSAGVAQGDEFRVNFFTPLPQRFPSVASDARGNFVVVWSSQGPGDIDGISGQRFDQNGAPQGSEFPVNSYTTGPQVRPSVAADPNGDFVVVWTDEAGQDGSDDGVFGQRYDSTGARLGAEFRVNSYTTDDQRRPSVTVGPSGRFVVAWASLNQDGPPGFAGLGVFGKRYDSEGAAQGGEFQINVHKAGDQESPSVAATGIDGFVVAWTSNDQDGDAEGVFGRRFDFGDGETITVVSPNTDVKWRIGSSQKIQWTHTLGANASFRVELDRDDDGGYEELVADDVAVDSATRGSFGWTVTGPVSAAARLRVTWTDERGVSDASDVTFQIRPAN